MMYLHNRKAESSVVVQLVYFSNYAQSLNVRMSFCLHMHSQYLFLSALTCYGFQIILTSLYVATQTNTKLKAITNLFRVFYKICNMCIMYNNSKIFTLIITAYTLT